jgi:hypothetical protein
MTARKPRSTATWGKVKAHLADMDRAGLVALLHNLYDASADNRNFLHSRFDLGASPLKPYKEIIRWALCPGMTSHRDPSPSQARRVLNDYKKAAGETPELVELMVYFCEKAVWFPSQFGYVDEALFNALIRVFGDAAKRVESVADDQLRRSFAQRLDHVCVAADAFGYGVADAMDALLEAHHLVELLPDEETDGDTESAKE